MSEARVRLRIEWTTAAVVALTAGLLSASLPDGDPDLFGRMEYARVAAAAGRLVSRVDPFSYTAAGAPWVDHEWGFNWIAWGAWSLGAWPALRAMTVLLFAATLVLAAWPPVEERAARATSGSATGGGTPTERGSTGRRAPSAPLMALAAAGAFYNLCSPRAHAFSCLFFAWMVFCLARSWSHSRRWIALAALPMPLWVNVHGGWLAGAAVLAVAALGRLAVARDRATARAVGVAAGITAASAFLLTPWGPGFPLRMLADATMVRPLVTEWAPIRGLDAVGIAFAIALVAAVVGIARTPGTWQRKAVDGTILAALALESLLHRRHLAFFAIAVTALAGEGLLSLRRRAAPAVEASPAEARALRRFSWALLAPLALLLAWTGRAVANRADESKEMPRAAVDWMIAHDVRGGVLADFTWSQYLLWRAWPATTVAFDGRYEEVYGPDVAARYFDWWTGADGWRSLPDDPGTRAALVAVGGPTEHRLDGLEGWTEGYRDGQAVVFLRTGVPGAP